MSFSEDVTQIAQAALRTAIVLKRRAKQQQASVSRLGAAYREAMEVWDTLKANGATFEQRRAGLEGVLRQFWPFTRTWTYVCDACDDYGLIIRTCDGGERPICGRRPGHHAHDFGTPCHCPRGRPFHPKKRLLTTDDFTAAGKVSKPTKLGRW